MSGARVQWNTRDNENLEACRTGWLDRQHRPGRVSDLTPPPERLGKELRQSSAMHRSHEAQNDIRRRRVLDDRRFARAG